MNAIDFLIKEHEQVRKTLTDIKNPSHHNETKRKMFQSLCDDLIRHETMEHQVWYPYFKNNKQLIDKVQHLLSEEKTAEKIIQQFDNIQMQEEWEFKFSKFKKDVEHHAKEEEQLLFPEVKKFFSKKELEKIGIEMYRFKMSYNPSTH